MVSLNCLCFPLLSLLINRSLFCKHSIAVLLLQEPGRKTTFASSTDSNELILGREAKRFRHQIHRLVRHNPSLAGPLLRLAFHDAATRDGDIGIGGPNGSIQYELNWSENRGLAKPLELVRESLESPSLRLSSLSLADAIALAGAEAVNTVGGPNIKIRLGRIDVPSSDPEYLLHPVKKSTSRSLVEKTLPSAALDSDGLRLYFSKLGLTTAEFVALCGSHGLGRHVSLLGMSKSCLRNLTRSCLEDAPVLLPFVTESVDTFNNSYFKALLRWNENQVELGEVAFIPTDVALVVDTDLRIFVEQFAESPRDFRRSFATAYQKLAELSTSSTLTMERY